MKDIEDFVNMNIKIEKQGNGHFGYYPFHCFVEKDDGGFDFVVIAGIDGVEDCYKLMSKYIDSKSKRVYMAIDFPSGDDMENDFVAVFESIGANHFNIFAIPYCTKTGKIYPRIKMSKRLYLIVTDLKHVAIRFWMEKDLKQN